VIRLWEQPTAPFLERPGLWPYAALTKTSDRLDVLQQVARKINTLQNRRQQANLSAISAVIAGLSLEKDVVQRILRRELMQESSMYQELQAWARADAVKELQQVRLEERLEAERSLILRLLTEQVGELSPEIRQQFEALPLAQLENLGIALLRFRSLEDLRSWLDALQ
jgi:predicted transposase YdaD